MSISISVLISIIALLFLIVNSEECRNEKSARGCPSPYCCDIANSCAFLLEQCVIFAEETYPSYCKTERDAKFCDSYLKCCNKYGDCEKNEEEDCTIYMEGHCSTDLKCENCCIMTRDKHYCGDKDICEKIRVIGIVILIIIIVYYVVVLIFFIIGIYKIHLTKRRMRKL